MMAVYVQSSQISRQGWRIVKIDQLLSDDAALAELGRRVAGTRLAANLTQAGLAKAAGVSKRTIERLEAGGGAQLVTLVRCLRALNRSEGLDRLLPEPQRNPLDLLERKAGARLRARPDRDQPSAGPWTWDDDK